MEDGTALSAADPQPTNGHTNGLTHSTTAHDAQDSLPSPVEEDGYESYAVSALEAASSIPASEEQRIQAYAKLEFADGDFYMTTYAVELGRDRFNTPSAFDAGWASSESGQPPGADSAGASVKMDDAEELERDSFSLDGNSAVGAGVNKSAREEVSSIASSSYPLSRSSSLKGSRKDYNALARPPSGGANLARNVNMEEFDLSAPLDCPLIPIQQPQRADEKPVNKKSISRRHARISFNFEKHYFELLFMGRNGGFLDEEWFAPGDIQPLVNGSVIQIGGLGVRFILPDVPPGETGADELEDTQSVEQEGSDDAQSVNSDEDDEMEEDDEVDEDDEEEEEPEEPRRAVGRKPGRPKSKPEPEPEPVKVKRKGPGRPPKNGIMSKREQAELARQAREEAKEASRRKLGSGKGRGKTAKALELEKSSLQPNGKRKYTKRKRAGGEGDQKIRESTEQTESVPPEHETSKPPKEKRPPKPPRSPSPVWDESKLTPEQLAKPQASYVILIHEALTNSKTGAMSLPQIYRAIERKYPYFKLRVTTQGWQSSVRHNLGQHAAFRKIERDGKGWMWGIDPDVSIEKERKRRTTPPPQTAPQQRYYPQPNLSHPRPPAYPYSMPQQTAQIPSHGHKPTHTTPHNYANPASFPNPPFPPRPPFSIPGFPLILNAKSDAIYQSPYDLSSRTKPANPAPSHPPYNAHTHLRPPAGATHPASFTASSLPRTTLSPQQLNLNPHTLSAIQKFKHALLSDMDDKVHAEKLISSAIERTFNPRKPSAGDSETDVKQETTIMTALNKLLNDLGARETADGGGAALQKSSEGRRAAEVAEEVVKSMPQSTSTSNTAEATRDKALSDTGSMKHTRPASEEESGRTEEKRAA